MSAPLGPLGPESATARRLPGPGAVSVVVLAGHTESSDRVAFEVDLDEHGWLVTGNPGVVTRCDVHHRRRDKRDVASIRILEVERPGGEEADMSVPALVGADQRAQVDGPSQPGGVDGPLDPRITDSYYVDRD